MTAFQDSLTAARDAQPFIRAALAAEIAENEASASESPVWSEVNEAKWAAYAQAADAIGPRAARVLDDSEESFLGLLQSFDGQPTLLARWTAP